MNEVKTKLMVTKKYLAQVYRELSTRLDTDIMQYNMNTMAGAIRVDTLGVISQCVRNIEFEVKKIEDAISLAEDMEKELVKTTK